MIIRMTMLVMLIAVVQAPPVLADPASDLRSILDELRDLDPSQDQGDHVVGEQLY